MIFFMKPAFFPKFLFFSRGHYGQNFIFVLLRRVTPRHVSHASPNGKSSGYEMALEPLAAPPIYAAKI
jgi:hypothetical protein